MAVPRVYDAWKDAGTMLTDIEGLGLTVSLHTSAYVPNYGTDAVFADATNELPTGGAYTAGGEAITTLADTVDTILHTALLTGDDTTWTGAMGPLRRAVVRETSGNRLVFAIDFGSDITIATALVLQWSVGILKVV